MDEHHQASRRSTTATTHRRRWRHQQRQHHSLEPQSQTQPPSNSNDGRREDNNNNNNNNNSSSSSSSVTSMLSLLEDALMIAQSRARVSEQWMANTNAKLEQTVQRLERRLQQQQQQQQRQQRQQSHDGHDDIAVTVTVTGWNDDDPIFGRGANSNPQPAPSSSESVVDQQQQQQQQQPPIVAQLPDEDRPRGEQQLNQQHQQSGILQSRSLSLLGDSSSSAFDESSESNQIVIDGTLLLRDTLHELFLLLNESRQDRSKLSTLALQEQSLTRTLIHRLIEAETRLRQMHSLFVPLLNVSRELPPTVTVPISSLSASFSDSYSSSSSSSSLSSSQESGDNGSEGSEQHPSIAAESGDEQSRSIVVRLFSGFVDFVFGTLRDAWDWFCGSASSVDADYSLSLHSWIPHKSLGGTSGGGSSSDWLEKSSASVWSDSLML